MDLTRIEWTGGPTEVDGIHANYWRLASEQKMTPPYVWEGSFKLNAVMDPPVFGAGSWKAGQVATYDPGINFMCMYPSNDRNVLIGIGRRSNPTGVGISAEMRDVRPNQPYGARTGYVSRVRNELPSDPADGRRHTFVAEVDSVDKYRLFVDGQLVADVVEKLPATIDPGPVSVGLRIDFCHIELGEMTLTKGDEAMKVHSGRPVTMHALPPARIVDTRNTRPLPVRAAYRLPLTGRPPDGARFAACTFVVVNPETDGYLTLWQGGAVPGTSNLNFRAGVDTTGFGYVPVGYDGSMAAYCTSRADLVVDMVGYLT